MGKSVNLGTGASLTMTSFTAELTDMSIDGIERAAIETTHLGTTKSSTGFGSKTFLLSKLADGGSLNVTGHHNPSSTPPIENDAGSITLTYPDGETWVFDGGMTGYNPTIPLEEKMTFTAVIKVCGPIVVTPTT